MSRMQMHVVSLISSALLPGHHAYTSPGTSSLAVPYIHRTTYFNALYNSHMPMPFSSLASCRYFGPNATHRSLIRDSENQPFPHSEPELLS